MLLEQTDKRAVDTEEMAKEMIEGYRKDAKDKGYRVKKASYEYKCKKAKGEIIAERYVVTVVMTFGELWEDIA